MLERLCASLSREEEGVNVSLGEAQGGCEVFLGPGRRDRQARQTSSQGKIVFVGAASARPEVWGLENRGNRGEEGQGFTVLHAPAHLPSSGHDHRRGGCTLDPINISPQPHNHLTHARWRQPGRPIIQPRHKIPTLHQRWCPLMPH